MGGIVLQTLYAQTGTAVEKNLVGFSVNFRLALERPFFASAQGSCLLRRAG
jgi:hypothetical protein